MAPEELTVFWICTNLALLNILLWHNMTWMPMQGRVYIIHVCLGQKGFVSQQKDREQNCLLLEILLCSLHNETVIR